MATLGNGTETVFDHIKRYSIWPIYNDGDKVEVAFFGYTTDIRVGKIVGIGNPDPFMPWWIVEFEENINEYCPLKVCTVQASFIRPLGSTEQFVCVSLKPMHKTT